MNKIASGIILILFVIGTTSLVFDVPSVRAEPGTIYIRADGSIDPPTANIKTSDNATYTFTDNNYDSIVVERNNIVIDGAGYTLQGTGVVSSIGINLTGRSNVTIKNTNIRSFWFAIYLSQSLGSIIMGNYITESPFGVSLEDSSNNSISGNNITDNRYYGVYVWNSADNNISGNNITANGSYGFFLVGSSNNTISENNIANNHYGNYLEDFSNNNSITGNNITDNRYYGVYVWNSADNSISGNNITDNRYYGVFLVGSFNSRVFHNNFNNNNPQQAYSDSSTNAWDDGYASGGNYWSDYNGTDADGDGIGDSPYVTGASNQDNYPLMYPYIAGDCDHNGIVNILDASLIGWYWQQTVPPAPKNVDINGDGIVDILDATIVGSNWLKHA